MVNLLNRRLLTMRASEPPKGGNWYRFAQNLAEGHTDIFIYDEIGFWGKSAQDFVDELKEVNTRNIHLHINSPGGELFDGLAIYNSLKQHQADVTTFVDALAASAASFIAMAGSEVVMARNATLMIHDGIGLTYGNEEDHLETAQLLSRFSNNIADIYMQKAGGSLDEWRSMMRAESWYSATEAQDAGLVDTVLDVEDEQAEEETNKWNLAAVFNYAGRDEAPSPKLVRERLKVTNRAKEGSMAKGTGQPQATTEGTGSSDQSSVESDNPPTAPVTEPSGAGETGDTSGDTDAEDSGPSVAEQTEDNPPADQPDEITERQNRAGRVLVNGVPTTDMRAIQAHISSLETFRDEAVESSRRTFVQQLAEDRKIAATQIDALTSLALTLDDGQYAAWSEAYNLTQSAPLFGEFGVTPTDSSSPQSQDTAGVQDRIEVLEGVIAQHRRTGMSEDAIKTTKSSKELDQLKAQVKE